MRVTLQQIDRRIAAIIILYFFISLTNVALKQEAEWFPLFSFKLFSRIPDDLVKYDIVFDQGTTHERYLLHQNNNLNVLERRHYEHVLSAVAKNPLEISNVEHLLGDATTASLVKISGDFVEAAKYSKFNIEIVLSIK